MDKIKSLFKNADTFISKTNISKKTWLLWFILLASFIAAASFVYINYIKPKLDVTEYKANYEFDSTSTASIKNTKKGKKATVYLFWADWCPNSNTQSTAGKKLHDTWDKLNSQYKQGKFTVDNNKLTFLKVNECDNDFAAHEAKVTKTEIEGFPSIYIMYDDYIPDTDGKMVPQTIIYELDATPSEDNIKDFINSALES